MNIQLNLAVKLVIQESETAMQTQRLVRQAWFGLISALLGSVFGLLGTFATGMSFFEGIMHRVEKRKKIVRVLRDTSKRNLNLLSVFGKFRVINRSSKVCPGEYTKETVT